MPAPTMLLVAYLKRLACDTAYDFFSNEFFLGRRELGTRARYDLSLFVPRTLTTLGLRNFGDTKRNF